MKFGKRHCDIDNTKWTKTLNGMGYTRLEPDEFGETFINFVKDSKLPALDIGAAMGAITIPTIKSGAYVIANDICSRQLDEIKKNTPIELLSKLKLLLGSFPDDLHIEDGSLGAVVASRVFHFIPPDKLIIGLQKIHSWLHPGGKLFVVCSTPFAKIFENFIPLYEKRKRSNESWPGYIENVFEYVDASEHAVPRSINLFDEQLLSKLLVEAGFIIEKSEYIPDQSEPSFYKLDGRESLGIIARRI